MTIWFIADTHFRHRNILKFENRPYDDIEGMEESMIEAWNNVVSKDDTVYIVGDFCFGGYNAWVDIIKRLKGELVLIKGNHDKPNLINRLQAEGYLSEVYDIGKLITVDGLHYHITHYPLDIGERVNMINISGHIHSQKSTYNNQLNVGVDSKLMNIYYTIMDLPFGTPIPFKYLYDYAEFHNELNIEKYKNKDGV